MRWIALLTCGALSGPILAAECPIDRDLGQGLRLDPKLVMGTSMLGGPAPSLGAFPQYLYGNKIDGSVDDQVDLIGSAEVRQLGSSVKADELRLDPVENELRGKGNVRFFREGELYSGPYLRLKPNIMKGFFDAAEYEFSSMNARGSSERVEFEKPKLTRLKGVTFSTCPRERPAWTLGATEMIVDQVREVVNTRDSVLSWGGVPLFPLGEFSFSTSSRRRSGLLSPRYAASSNLGFEFSIPYYWNMAPNRDLTLTPKLISRRGVQLGLEHRYLEPSYSGVVDYEIIPNDRVETTRSNRSFVRLSHLGKVTEKVNFSISGARASDDRYLSDFGGGLLASSQRILPATVVASASHRGWNFSVTGQRFQLLKDPSSPILPPYEVAPRIAANRSEHAAQLPNWGGDNLIDWQASFEITNFTHKTLAEGNRFVSSAKASIPTYLGPLEVTPRVGFHATQFERDSAGSLFATQDLYRVSEQSLRDGLYRNNIGTVGSYQRFVPTFGLENKVTLERETHMGGAAATQILEPRVIYNYVPYRDQTNLPVFDSAPVTLGLSQLLSDSVYSGNDRVADQNHVTAALTSRFLSNRTGEEFVSATVAQRYYVDNQMVTLPGEVGRTDRESDVLSEVSLRYSRQLRGSLATQYTPKTKRMQAGSASAIYQARPGLSSSLSYRYQRETFDTVDAAFQAPLSSNWYAVGRFNYSFQSATRLNPSQTPRLVEGLIGAEYDGGCWVGRVVVQQFVTSTTQRPTQIFFQIELNGIGRVGTDPLSALKTSIPNYRMINQLSPLPSRFENFQ